MALWIDAMEAIELRPNATEEDLQAIIRATYRQIFGNAHIMDSQRLVAAESQLRNGDITVRGFVRALAQSDLYRSLFFDTSSPYRFIELNCKHLLGRAPHDQREIADHVQRYNKQGYEADIDSYINSEEYLENFGENTVPYYRSNQTQSGIKNVGFNRTFTLVRGFAANDFDKQAKLIGDVAGNLPTKITFPGGGSGSYSNTGKRFRITAFKGKSGSRMTRSTTTFEVGYDQLSQNIQNIHKSGGKILIVTEAS